MVGQVASNSWLKSQDDVAMSYMHNSERLNLDAVVSCCGQWRMIKG